MKLKSIYIIIMIFVIRIGLCSGQDMKRIDSLEKIVTETKIDTIRINTLNDLFFEYEYANRDIAKKYLKKAFVLAKEIDFRKGLANTVFNLGLIADDEGNLSEALSRFKLSLEIRKTLGIKKDIASSYNAIGVIFSELGSYPEALDNYFSGLKIMEEIGYAKGIAKSYNNIGNIYKAQANYSEALKCYQASLKIKLTLGNKQSIGITYVNVGNIYKDQGNNSKALENYKNGYDLFNEINDERGIADYHVNVGTIYSQTRNYEEALKNYFASLKINEKNEDNLSIAFSLINIGSVYVQSGNYSKAENYLLQAEKISKEIKYKEQIKNTYNSLTKLYSKKGEYEKAFNSYKLYVLYNDSLNNEESQKKTIQVKMTYEFEKKEAVATAEHKMELENQKSLSEEKSRKQNLVILLIVLGLLLVIIFAGFIFRSLRITKNQKKTIEIQKLEVDEKNSQLNQQNEEISTQRDEIEAQRDEIEAQRDLVTIQKEQIEEVHNEVKASINYAKRIQEAVLPVSENSRAVLGEHFILFKPKDIVSGDFYWTTKINNWLIVAVADCTGHGVPGAFMSMLGISFLNEIVQKKEIHKASQILNVLRSEVINALQQKGVQGEQKDGMDISLLVLNTETNEAQWAGANNPLYIIKKFDDLKMNQFESDIASSNLQINQLSNQFIELKGDKMPIAIYPAMKDFTNYEFSLHKGDCVYLFTDGYADQFGGPKGRKFMYKQFKDILLQNNKKSMFEQKNMLEIAFENWRINSEQIDDITVLGIKIYDGKKL